MDKLLQFLQNEKKHAKKFRISPEKVCNNLLICWSLLPCDSSNSNFINSYSLVIYVTIVFHCFHSSLFAKYHVFLNNPRRVCRLVSPSVLCIAVLICIRKMKHMTEWVSDWVYEWMRNIISVRSKHVNLLWEEALSLQNATENPRIMTGMSRGLKAMTSGSWQH